MYIMLNNICTHLLTLFALNEDRPVLTREISDDLSSVRVYKVKRSVIMARGLGTRMRQQDAGSTLSNEQTTAADAGVKGMIPTGRPFLDYVISALADAGITDVCLVIGPEHTLVREYYSAEGRLARVRVHFAIQQLPLGTANAVAAAESFAGDDVVLVLNSDNYYPVESLRAIAELGASGLVGFERRALIALGNMPAERVQAFALCERGADSRLESMIEKPDDATFARMATSSLVSMNLWSFTPVIFEACRRVQRSERGELELQDAVTIARHELGEPFIVVPFSGGVLDLSTRGDVATVAQRLIGVTVSL